ncbi:MAG: DNA polymerase III subunit chi [Pseudomonadota bacterium]
MTEINFYHLTSTALEAALPKLLEKSLQAGFKSVVLFESEESRESINNILWTFDANSFLPHGSELDGNKELQPIYLSCKNENPNKANLLVVTDGRKIGADDDFERVIDIFDGKNEVSVIKARERWKIYKESDKVLKYYKQSESGGWAIQNK